MVHIWESPHTSRNLPDSALGMQQQPCVAAEPPLGSLSLCVDCPPEWPAAHRPLILGWRLSTLSCTSA